MDSAQSTVIVNKKNNPTFLRNILIAMLLILVAVLSAILVKIYLFDSTSEKNINIFSSDAYTAVFLENGQVYFGKVIENNTLEIQLTGVYFLRVDQVTTGETDENADALTQPQLTLVKRSDTLHKPIEPMVINKAHMILMEPLSPDSDVITAIQELEKEDTTENQ